MIKKIIDVNGQPWTAVVTGDTIRFYDGRYMHTENGQFVSEYHTKTIMEHGDYGLNLDFGVPTWTITAQGIKQIKDWLNDAERDYKIEILAQYALERAEQKELEEIFLDHVKSDLKYNDNKELDRLIEEYELVVDTTH